MTRSHVKQIAIAMVRDSGLINLSRRELCERAGVPDGSFLHLMGCNFSQFIKDLKPYDKIVYPVNKTRADPALRREHILNIAVSMSKINGYHKITRDAIAERAGVSMGLVTRYFGTMTKLRRAIIRAAIAQKIPEIIAQGIANGDSHAKKVSGELKTQAINLITNY